jgi:hypothetical protein
VRRVALGLAAATLALVCPLAADSAEASTYPGDAGFRLLKLSGHYVKWGDHSLGSGATVTYAFVDESMRFSNARNCGHLVPMDGLLDHSGISREKLEAEAEAAFRIWEDVADITFVPTEQPAEADILIGAQGRPVGRAFANVFYQPGSDNDVTIIDRALICLNPNHQWKVGFDGNTRVYDLRYTFVHEIGHAIGLDHPGASGQVMSFRYEEKHSDLQAGDLHGVALLYGNGRALMASDDKPGASPETGRGFVGQQVRSAVPGTSAGP